MRKGGIVATLDQNFEAVLDGCADRSETWINDTIRDLMLELFRLGHAHSFEVHRDGALIGGMYGIALGGAFFGEIMFSRATGGAKMNLAFKIYSSIETVISSLLPTIIWS